MGEASRFAPKTPRSATFEVTQLPTLTPTQAIAASVVIVIGVIVAWKFLKFAFKIGLLLVAAIGIFFALRWAGFL